MPSCYSSEAGSTGANAAIAAAVPPTPRVARRFTASVAAAPPAPADCRIAKALPAATAGPWSEAAIEPSSMSMLRQKADSAFRGAYQRRFQQYQIQQLPVMPVRRGLVLQ